MTKSLPEYLNNVVQCTRSLREVLRQAAALAVWAAPGGSGAARRVRGSLLGLSAAGKWSA